jgi:hypothetical protein
MHWKIFFYILIRFYEEVRGTLLEAGSERSAILEEVDSMLNGVAPAVADRVTGDKATRTVKVELATRRDDGADAVAAEPLADVANLYRC